MFENYKDSLINNKIILKSQPRFRSDHHKVFTEEINKIALRIMMIKDYKHMIELLRFHMEW